jgi:hypothetical protein
LTALKAIAMIAMTDCLKGTMILAMPKHPMTLPIAKEMND